MIKELKRTRRDKNILKMLQIKFKLKKNKLIKKNGRKRRKNLRKTQLKKFNRPNEVKSLNHKALEKLSIKILKTTINLFFLVPI